MSEKLDLDLVGRCREVEVVGPRGLFPRASTCCIYTCVCVYTYIEREIYTHIVVYIYIYMYIYIHT